MRVRRVLRGVGIGLAVAVCGLLGVVQFLSSVALRSDAQRGAWVRFVGPGVAGAIDRIDPAYPIPPALRLVLARKALAARDFAFAEQEADRLGSSREGLSLRAELAAARGVTATALRAYLSAGDVAGLEGQVATLESQGRIVDALALQHATVARMQADRTQSDSLAQAYFRLGRLEEAQAERLAPQTARRRRHEVQAAEAYASAVKLAPFDVNFLIGYGNQELNLGDLTKAEEAFGRAREADPRSAEPLTGLGDAAYRRGDRGTARAYLLRARALDPTSDAVHRLARQLGS